METSEASNPWPKALNKRNTHNVHQNRECYLQFNKQLTHDVHIHKGLTLNVTKCKMHTCILYRLIGVKDSFVELKYSEM